MPDVAAVEADDLVVQRCAVVPVEQPLDVDVRRGLERIGQVWHDPEHRDAALLGDLGGVLRGEGGVGAALDVAQHHAADVEPAAARRLDGERGVADGAEAGARRDHHRSAEAAGQVAHRHGGGERHQQAADAFDDQHLDGRGALANGAQQRVDVDLALLGARRGQR